MIRARAIALATAVALLGSGCATSQWKWPSLPWLGRTPSSAPSPAVTIPPPSTPPQGLAGRGTDPVYLVTRANEFARDGMVLAARDLYEQVIHDYPVHPVRAWALFGLGQLQADPASPLRDYRVAYLTFGRVLADHPHSRWEPETRVWRGLLSELMARDDEAQRLRLQLQKLRRIEVDLDKSR